MRTAQDKLLSAGDMSGTITSDPVQLDQVFGYSIQAVFSTSGSLTGTLKLQASVNHLKPPVGGVSVDGNWDDIVNSPKVISGAGTYIWNVFDSNYPWVRVVYTPGMGDTGSLDLYYFLRGF